MDFKRESIPQFVFNNIINCEVTFHTGIWNRTYNKCQSKFRNIFETFTASRTWCIGSSLLLNCCHSMSFLLPYIWFLWMWFSMGLMSGFSWEVAILGCKSATIFNVDKFSGSLFWICSAKHHKKFLHLSLTSNKSMTVSSCDTVCMRCS